MTLDRKEELADQISKQIVSQLCDNPNIAGFYALGWRGTGDLESEIYGFLMEHASFKEAE